MDSRVSDTPAQDEGQRPRVRTLLPAVAGCGRCVNGCIVIVLEVTPVTRDLEETLIRHQSGAASNHLIQPVGS